VFLTTHLGEGYGLSQVEAMSCGLPVVAPNNTCVSELLGESSERGYMYECKDTIWIDRSGPRKKGLIPDIVEQMVLATNEGKEDNQKVNNALRWVRENTWSEMCKRWVALFRQLEHFDNFNKVTDTIGEIV
jgi:glycosyltransferase involved in cell wall biosynthesis